MRKGEIHLTTEFKTQSTMAILSIVFFVFTYLLILLLSVGLTALCIAICVYVVALKPMFITIVLGVGLSSMGILVLVFLVKFIFKSHKVDRSHFYEVYRADEPELFNLIDEIVQRVGTSYPKRVYLSAEVNASVFYDSNFWSMFFPVKKNLHIGLGLVNAITREELKAILSHEFGHFSQRTMKVGSYVYNVNQVIFNLLFDNEAYDNLVQKWASGSDYFLIFVNLAVKINQAIQWVLRKMYEVVNKSYMGLSREMEFHADEIAASVTGYEPLKSSLLRMSLVDNSYSNVLNFYSSRISENIKSENLFKNQTAVIKFLADINKLPVKNSLPDITLEEQSKFDKSKLVIKDQWASHPTIKERIERLEKTNFLSQKITDTHANNVFRNIEETQKRITSKLFESVSYEGETKLISFEDFKNEFKNEILSNSFSTIYNGYYDNKNPISFDLSQGQTTMNINTVQELFSDENVDLVYSAIALKNDLETITNISNKSLSIKTFDYDGIRYKRKQAKELIEKLKLELEATNEQIKKHDSNIYSFFRRLEQEQNKPNELERIYSEFFAFDIAFDAKYDLYLNLLRDLQFVSVTTPIEQISDNLSKIKQTEKNLKKEIEFILSDKLYESEITVEIKENLNLYTSKTWWYFDGTKYDNENLNLFYTALHNYAYLLSKGYLKMKKNLLTYQEELFRSCTIKR